MVISIRLNDQEEHQLNYLLDDLNREPKPYRDLTKSDIFRIGLNNEWYRNNLFHQQNNENDLIDPIWKKQNSR